MVASQFTSAPLVVVFGATGAQGSSVVNHLIASEKEYRIKGVTRDPTKPSGQALQDQGVESIKADLSNLDQVSSAIKGANVVFGVTNFWESGSDGELQQGRNLIKAIQTSDSAPLFIFSGLPASSKISNGKYTKVEHFDNKALLFAEAQQAGVKVLSVEPACYMENFSSVMTPRKQEDGSFVLTLPMQEGKFTLINVRRDYGAFVVAALEAGQTSGRVLAGVEDVSASQIAADIAQASGKDVKYQYVPVDVFAGFAGEEFAQMLAYFDEFGYFGGEPVSDLARGKVQSWKEFIKAQDWSKILV